MMVRTRTEPCPQTKGLGSGTATKRECFPVPAILRYRIQHIAINIVTVTALIGCGRELTPEQQLFLSKGPQTIEGGEQSSLIRSAESGSGTQIARRARDARSLRAVENPVRGIVTDADGSPVNRARVKLFRRIREWPRADRHCMRCTLCGRS